MPVDLQQAHLDRGERDTLALAESLYGRLILIDETAGRQLARARGFVVRGSLGMLIEAYRLGLLSSDQFRLNMTEIANRQDIWVNPALVERLLHEALG
jgi:predicted nucleic acid-binding protein